MDGVSYTKSEHGNDDDNPGNDLDMHSNMGGHGDNSKQGKRRTRNDPDSRNFTCGCGKAYLSYAALYTHIKTKHDGIAPQGTSQPNTNGKSSRGRPKKEDSAIKTREEEKSDDEILDVNKSMQDFLDFLSKLGANIRYDNQNIKENENGLLLTTSSSSTLISSRQQQQQKYDIIDSFPYEIFPSAQENEYRPIIENLKLLKVAHHSNILQDDIDTQTDLKKTKLNKIFAIFLIQLSQYVRVEFYKELCFFICIYRKTLNQYGWNIKKMVTGKDIDPKEMNTEYCEVNNGEYAPDVSNDFITETLPEYLQRDYDLKRFKVLGSINEQMHNAILLTQYFCDWLNANKYTNSRLTINPEGN